MLLITKPSATTAAPDGADVYCKFSGFTQKLPGAWASDAYSPQGLTPVVSKEAPPSILATPTELSSNSTAYDYAGKTKFQRHKSFFQKPDGVPIHLKRGLPDQMLHRTTMALMVGGPIYCLISLYMAQKQKS
ncbi:cytochrome c oxidase subunit 7A-related protein, mitochondrial-like [Camelus dromedarius]|uniref:cytochrome c oxidase subunit 7A-related protein, mitochondrial-like n=1 Tax=Camelus dromedarius TaxID=9838 RepID=UPI00311A0ACC